MVVPSTPSLPTVEEPSSSSSAPAAATRHTRAARKPKAVAPFPLQAVPTSTPSLPTVEAPSTGGGSSGQLAARRHIGAAKKFLMKYKAVVGASKRLQPVKHAVEYLIDTTAARPVASR